LTRLASRFGAFVVERYPFALPDAVEAFEAATRGRVPDDEHGLDRLRPAFARELSRRLVSRPLPSDLPDTTPRVSVDVRLRQAIEELLDACDGFLRRAALEASLTADERREILSGMILARAIDNRLKAFYLSSEIRYRDTVVQGKGFRSLGQEAIYAAGIRLRRGPAFQRPDGTWGGDVVAPIIRDLGVALAMRRDAHTVRLVLNGQIGKAGPGFDGRDLHYGDFDRGVLPPAAPLGISTLTVSGLAMAFRREGTGRVALGFIGEGGSSLGEWHEAVNVCAVRRLPAVFCIENNQTALGTPVAEQSAVRVFADKAAGYGIPGITLDGNDPDLIAAGFAWAVERAREGLGPTLIELVTMRMGGHAHHDDMLFLGRDAPPSWEYPVLTGQGYADHELYEYWRGRDPIALYSRRLEDDGIITPGDVERFRREAEAMVEEQARALIDAPWPDPDKVGVGVLAGERPRRRVEVLDRSVQERLQPHRAEDNEIRGEVSAKERAGGGAPAPLEKDAGGQAALPPLDPGPPFDPKGRTFLEAITLAIGDALRADPRVFVFGEDVGRPYGNAFLLLKPLLAEFGDRILNAPLAEGGILGVAIGAALAGQRPIAEMQFNDFVATGFNQLVNNAAKIRYRWGHDVPMVVRMPSGGLRHAGPYHSQNTESWFYRTPGLKIAVPSTPWDARALFAAAMADPDPVLFFEHIALYRDPRIRQVIGDTPAVPAPVGRAALRREGRDIAIVSYGAYVHVALEVATRLAEDGIAASVLDLRWLSPLDRDAVLGIARHCRRVLIVHEDSRTGGIGESLAAIIQEEAFEALDAPVRIVGALDTPVPYSPPLEERFLPSAGEIERAARLLVAFRAIR
jgi:2-oxoisovalerate dehydrogenase E1 component